MSDRQPVTPATAEEVQALRDALSKATQGEWDKCPGVFDHETILNDRGEPIAGAHKSNVGFIILAHNLTPKLLARLDAAVYDAKVQSQRADATMVELEKIHRLLGRGDGHGSLHATADCVICGIVTLKERVAEAEAESARLQEALDAAEAEVAQIKQLQITCRDGRCPNCGFAAEDCEGWKSTAAEMDRLRSEIARLKAGGCARDQRTTQHCADAVAAVAQAVEFAWAFVTQCQDGRGGYNDCFNTDIVKAALYLESRGLLKRTGEHTWQRVEGK